MRLLVFLGFFLLLPAFAASLEEGLCEASLRPGCQGVRAILPEFPIPADFSEIVALNREASSLLAHMQSQLDHWGDFTRWLRGTELKRPDPGHAQRWGRVLTAGQALFNLHQELKVARARRDICYRGSCHSVRRVELEDQTRNLERAVFELSALNPWWNSEDFQEMAAQRAELPSEADFKQLLGRSMHQFFDTFFELRRQVSVIELRTRGFLEGEIGGTSGQLHFELLLKQPQGIELLLRRAQIHGGSDPQALCQLARRKSSWDQLRKNSQTGLTIGLVASSLLLGPEAILLGVAGRSASSGLWARLASTLASAPRSSGYLSDAALAAQLLEERRQLGAECHRKKTLEIMDLAGLEEWQGCLADRSQASLELALATLPLGVRTSLWAQQGLRPYLRPPAPAIHTRSEGVHQLSTLDLAQRAQLATRELRQLPDDYWQLVGDVYRSRLNLSDAEIASFIASSRAYEARTQLVVMTRGPPGRSPIDGGVALVTSGRVSDPLPLEKATGIQLDRSQGAVAEIVRLTSVSKDSPQLMHTLLTEIAQLSARRPELKKIYVYTSKVHARLYGRLGIKARQIGQPIDRDVVIEIDAEEFRRGISSRP